MSLTVEELQIIISAQTEKVQGKIQKLKDSLAGLTSRTQSAAVNMDTSGAQNQLRRLQAEMDKTQAKIDRIKQTLAGAYARQDAIAQNYSQMPPLTGMSRGQSTDTMIGHDTEYQGLTQRINDLENSLNPLNQSLAGTQARMNAVSEQMSRAVPKSNAATKSVKAMGDSFNRTSGHTSMLTRMLQRMFLGMLLYKGISFIFGSVKQGLDNLVMGNTSANTTVSALATSFLYLQNSLATAFLPILQAITPTLTGVMDSISGFANYIGMISAVLFNNASSFVEAKKANVDYAAALRKTGALAGIDEINHIGTPTPGYPDPTQMFQTVKIPDSVKTTAEGIKKTLEPLFDFIEKHGPAVIGVLAGIVAAILLFKAISSIISFVTGLGTAFAFLADPVTWIVIGILALAAVLVYLWNTNAGFRDAVIGAWNDIKQTAFNVWNSISGKVSEAWNNICSIAQNAYTTILKPVFDQLGKTFTELWDNHLKPLWDNISAFIMKFVNDMLDLWNTTLAPFLNWFIVNFGPVIVTCFNTVITVVGIVYGTVCDVISGILKVLGGIIDFITGVFTGNWSKAWLGIQEIFGGIWDIISSVFMGFINMVLAEFTGIWTAITQIFGAVGPWFAGVFEGAWNGITGAFSAIGSFFGGLWSGIKSGFVSLVNFLIDGINTMINAFLIPLNVLITGWNNSIGKVIGSIPAITVSIPHIPKLAAGAIVSSPTIAQIGESGKEAVVPLENNTSWISKLAADINNENGGGDTYLETTIMLDGVIADKQTRKLTRQSRNRNKPAFGY
jgi:phage-related protein/predicted  nucleic acid-binding Zn-ribbon protein